MSVKGSQNTWIVDRVDLGANDVYLLSGMTNRHFQVATLHRSYYPCCATPLPSFPSSFR